MKQKLGLLVLWWLRFWATLQLKKFAPDIIGITGSAGKTSCRNAVAALLQDKYRLKVTGKANSESGIPLDILDIHPRDFSVVDWIRMSLLAPVAVLTHWHAYEKYVVEMGIDSPNPPKNMSYLLTIVRPRTAIFLNALPVHTANFDHLIRGRGRQAAIEAIASEKGKLITTLPQNGLAILNADQPEVERLAGHTKARVMTFGTRNTASIRVGEIRRNADGTRFTFWDGENSARVALPYLLPDYYGATLAAALCINADEGNTLADGCRLLENNFVLEPGRMSVFTGVGGSVLIDSSYNASAEPTIGALKMLAELPAKRRFAILGTMNELGQEAQEETARVMKVANQVCDEVVVVGRGQLTAIEAAAYLKPKLRSGDYVLIKGSQNGVFLELAVEQLLAHKRDVNRLCRRGKVWDIQRSLIK